MEESSTLWRPKTTHAIRALIRKMSLANSRSGAPRIHGELMKLGIDIGETTVAKYMMRADRLRKPGKHF
jgi:hypothetical protein